MCRMSWCEGHSRHMEIESGDRRCPSSSVAAVARRQRRRSCATCRKSEHVATYCLPPRRTVVTFQLGDASQRRIFCFTQRAVLGGRDRLIEHCIFNVLDYVFSGFTGSRLVVIYWIIQQTEIHCASNLTCTLCIVMQFLNTAVSTFFEVLREHRFFIFSFFPLSTFSP